MSAFKTPVHLMSQDSLMLDGRPTFAVGYDRSFSSTEEVDDFLANSEEREVRRNGLSVFCDACSAAPSTSANWSCVRAIFKEPHVRQRLRCDRPSYRS